MGLEGLGNLIKGLENQDSWQTQRQFRLVLLHWPKAVGFAVARQTKPTSIHRSELYVATATPVWAQTLTYERFKILQKLNRHQPKPIKNIRFSTALWASDSSGSQKTSTANTAGQIRHRPQSHTDQTIQSFEYSPTTPTEAFERWARIMQQAQSDQALCPRCRCRCPHEELDRWSICALCASKQWQ